MNFAWATPANCTAASLAGVSPLGTKQSPPSSTPDVTWESYQYQPYVTGDGAQPLLTTYTEPVTPGQAPVSYTLDYPNQGEQVDWRTLSTQMRVGYAYNGSSCTRTMQNGSATMVEPAISNVTYGKPLVTTFNFDGLGRDTGHVDAYGNTTTIGYYSNLFPTLPTSITLPDGNIMLISYDGYGNVQSVTKE